MESTREIIMRRIYSTILNSHSKPRILYQLSQLSSRLLKPLFPIEYSLTCPRKPFRTSLSRSLEGTQVTLVENTKIDLYYRTGGIDSISSRRGALNRSSKLIAHIIGHFITSITV